MTKKEVSYPESQLTEKIIGLAFQVYNSLGRGFPEIIYHRALAHKFKEANLNFKQEVYYPIVFEGKGIGSNRVDFLIDNRVVVEIKSRSEIYDKDIWQILNYLEHNKLTIGLLICFGKHAVKVKRIIK